MKSESVKRKLRKLRAEADRSARYDLRRVGKRGHLLDMISYEIGRLDGLKDALDLVNEGP